MAGIIPGADFIPDLVGMTYATLRGDVNKAGEYVLGVAMVGVSTGVLVLGSKMIGKTVNTIAHRGRQLSINASNRLESVLLPRYRPQIATSEIFNLEFARHSDISPGFIKFAREEKFSAHQLKAIAKGEAAETERKWAQMRVLEREGRDVFHTLRGKTFSKLEDLADGLTDFEQRKVFSTALKEMDDITLGKLNKDLENEAFKNYLAGNTDGVTNWKTLLDEGLDQSIRKSPDALSDLDAALDAVQISGKRTWPEIQALWKRGNDFNRKAKAEAWCDFNEVHLENGKRLDGYDHDLGEIVSRKATDFDNIQLATFEKYLKEIDKKSTRHNHQNK